MGIRSHAIHEWNYTVYVVDEHGDVLETLAHARNHDVAIAAFEAATQTRSWSRLELRNMARVVRVARTGGYDRVAQRMDLLA